MNMKPEVNYQVYFSYKDGQWEAYYDYGTRHPASVLGTGATPEEAFSNLIKSL